MHSNLWSDNTHKDFYKLAIALKDISDAKAILELIAERSLSYMDSLYQPLSNGFVVCYSKPFLHNKPFGKLESKWKAYKTTELLNAHKEILKLRNKLAAHSDASSHTAMFFSPGTIRAGKEDSMSLLINDELEFAISTKLLNIDKLEVYHSMCSNLQDRLMNEVDKKMVSIRGSIELPPNGILQITF